MIKMNLHEFIACVDMVDKFCDKHDFVLDCLDAVNLSLESVTGGGIHIHIWFDESLDKSRKKKKG